MISFSLTEEQELLRDTVRKFAKDELRPNLRAFEKERQLPTALRKKFAGLGLGLAAVPEEIGGLGLGLLSELLIHEELAYGDPGVAVALWSQQSVAHALIELAEAEQARALLLPFADGTAHGSLAWSEPGSNEDDGFATCARPDGERYLLSGTKCHVVGADVADALVVLAQLDPDKGWDGVGAFFVDGADLATRPAEADEWVGLETVRAGSVVFDDTPAVRLQRDSVQNIQRLLARVALVSAARQTGLARASYELALWYTQDRIAFGKPVAHFQAISFTLAEMAMDVDSARWMIWKAAVTLDAGDATGVTWAAKAALQANDNAWRVADNGVQLLGGAGYVDDHPAEKWMRDTKVLATMGPSDTFHRLMIAAELAGQPGDLGTRLPSATLQPMVT